MDQYLTGQLVLCPTSFGIKGEACRPSEERVELRGDAECEYVNRFVTGFRLNDQTQRGASTHPGIALLGVFSYAPNIDTGAILTHIF